MSQLRSLLDHMAAQDDGHLTSEELAADITELVHAQQMIEVLVADKTRSLSERRGLEELGYPSPTAFSKHRARMSGGHARHVVSQANSQQRAAGCVHGVG